MWAEMMLFLGAESEFWRRFRRRPRTLVYTACREHRASEGLQGHENRSPVGSWKPERSLEKHGREALAPRLILEEHTADPVLLVLYFTPQKFCG